MLMGHWDTVILRVLSPLEAFAPASLSTGAACLFGAGLAPDGRLL